MRKIKFRAWNIDHKRMEYISDLYWFEENGVLDDSGMGSSSDYTLEQFTGCYDKNGMEIYEGDILKTTNYFGVGTGIVENNGWSFSIAQLQCSGALVWCSPEGEHWTCDETEVIGNIHETPELLK